MNEVELLNNRLDDMINKVQHEIRKQPQILEHILKDVEKPLHLSCANHTILFNVLKLFNQKARYGWCDKRFFEVLAFHKSFSSFPK